MKFSKDVLQEIANDESEAFEKVEDKIIDNGRWSIVYEMIFKTPTGKFYRSFFNRGATEMQDEQPYEYDEDIIECEEVVWKEITISAWLAKED